MDVLGRVEAGEASEIAVWKYSRFGRNRLGVAVNLARLEKELPGFDENAYVENADFNSRLLKDLASEYRQVREANMYLFRSFSPNDLRMVGLSNGNPLSVRTLLYLVAGHEIHHMNIIKERYL